jgi:Putative  PD-(D/E)XK family member, (DUF4420)
VIDALTVWDELVASAPQQTGIVRRRLAPESGRDIFLAVAHPSVERMLILAVSSSSLPSARDLPSTRGVRTTVVPIDDSRTEVRVSLASAEILRVFATFVEDVAASAATEDNDAGALRAFATRFAHWRHLLAGEPRAGLTKDEAQGLWGELWVLRHVLHDAWGGAVVDAWTGSDRDAKDFRLGALTVEVKTTRADAPHAVRINGEHQLEDPGEGVALLLAVLDVEAHQQGIGETLNEAVSATRKLASGTTLAQLDEKLATYGYLDGDRELYEERRYVLRSALWYRVEPGFPRLTGADLPDGVGRVTYLLSTDAASPWRLGEDDLSQLIGGAVK